MGVTPIYGKPQRRWEKSQPSHAGTGSLRDRISDKKLVRASLRRGGSGPRFAAKRPVLARSAEFGPKIGDPPMLGSTIAEFARSG